MKNKSFTILLIVALAACTSISCAGSRKTTRQHTTTIIHGHNAPYNTTTIESDDTRHNIAILSTKEFNMIQNNVVTKITLKTGDRCKVELHGNSIARNNAKINVSNGILTIKNSIEAYDPDAEYVIYMPKINKIKNKGRLYIKAKNITTDNLEIVNTGLIEASFGNIKCSNAFGYNNMGQSEDVTFTNIDADSICLKNTGCLGLSITKIICGNLAINNKGQYKISGRINSSSMKVSNTGILECNATVEGTSLKLSNNGQADIQATFKGTEMQVKNSGYGKISLNVDCRQLTADNSGQCNLSISGNADKADVTGKGMYNINTRELNKF